MRHRQLFSACIIASSLLSFYGCAHQTETGVKAESAVDIVNKRLQESERINSRLTVRVEELEDQIFLLQDRVDANRIALQRRGVVGQRQYAQRVDAPNPSQETYYPPQQYGRKVPVQKQVTRIPLAKQETYEYSDQPLTSRVEAQPNVSTESEEIVISEEEFQAFVHKHGDSPRPAAKSTGTKVPQAPVTDERLATSNELGKAPVRSSKKGLALYKQSLTKYRAAQYSDALTGFTAFLDSGPKVDYVDNALYWIGECHFGLGNHRSAVEFFQRVLSEQPDGNKVPDAILKMALAYEHLGKSSESEKLLEDLSANYPATGAGKLGAKKLQERGQ